MRQQNQQRQSQPGRWTRLLSQIVLLSVGTAIVLAHEGHAPLPTKGVQVDPDHGTIILAAPSRQALDVQTAEVESRVIEEQVQAYATLTAPWQGHAFATSRLSGKIARLDVKPGDHVTAGQMLAVVESSQLETLQLELVNAGNEAALAEKVLETMRASPGAVPAQKIQEAETKLKQNRNALEVAKTKWASLGFDDKAMTLMLEGKKADGPLTLPIRSPVQGVVIHADLTVGKVVEPADHLFEVVDQRKVWARIDVLERDLHRVSVGQPVELRLAAYPGEVFRSTIQAHSFSLDPKTHLGRFWAEFENSPDAPARFLAGMNGEARILNKVASSAKVIPAAALIEDGLDRYVLVEEAKAEAASEYRRRSVVVIRRGGDWVQIESDKLFPGDRVIVQGNHELATYFVPESLSLSPESKTTIKLEVEPARSRPVEDVVVLEGNVEVPPTLRTQPAAQLAGTLEKVHVDRGQKVQKGDLLAEVFSLDFHSLQLDLIREALELRLLEQQLESYSKLGDLVSRRQVVEQESLVTTSRNRLGSLRRRLELLGMEPKHVEELVRNKKLIELLPVRATADGTVVHFDTVLGQAVRPEEKLFAIHDLEQPWVQGHVPEKDLGKVRVGHAVRVRLNSDPGVILNGKVVRISGILNEQSRTMSIWVGLEKRPARTLLHQQLARLTLTVDQSRPVLAIPVTALVQEGTRSFVFAYRKDSKSFDRVLVEPGRADDRFVEIVSGLETGTEIAVQGTTDLQTAYAAIR